MNNTSEDKSGENKEKAPGRESTPEQVVKSLYEEKMGEMREKEPTQEEEKRIKEILEREVEKMENVPALKEEAKKRGEQIKLLDKLGKIKRLLDLAEKKDVIFAVGVAKAMNDPYTLDAFHDVLSQKGFYKRFEK